MMSDPHVPRHPLPALIQYLLEARRPRHVEPTSTASGHRPTTSKPGIIGPLSARQYEVLQAVADQRIRRDILLGTLEPHLRDGHDVIWTLRALVVRRLVQFQPIGPPRLTARGRRTLDFPD